MEPPLTKWGDKFFQDVEQRTKEITERFASEVRESVKAGCGIDIGVPSDIAALNLGVGAGGEHEGKQNSSTEIRTEIEQRARQVVNSLHVQQLTGILELLDEVLDDTQKPCYLVIDRLDEDWVDEALRFRLLKGLLDTVREFSRVRNAKVIIALRSDLLQRVFRECRSDAGFQEDKYRSLYLTLDWTKEQLVQLLDKRVAHLVRDAYTQHRPTFGDILPSRIRIGSQRLDTLDYLLDRTWYRPRDVIDLINECITRSVGRTDVSKQVIIDAEGEYSRNRLRSLAEEWHGVYPGLVDAAKRLLVRRPSRFTLSECEESQIGDWMLGVCCEGGGAGRLGAMSREFVEGRLSYEVARRELFTIFYRTGIIGVKMTDQDSVRWSLGGDIGMSPAEMHDSTVIQVHCALWRVFGIVPPGLSADARSEPGE